MRNVLDPSIYDIATVFDANGGFVCGDRKSGLTAYAYPTSTHARQAKRKPLDVAIVMLSKQPTHRPEGYDARNWEMMTPA